MGHDLMRTGRAAALLGAALLALGAGGAAEAAPYNIFIERVTSPFSPPGAPEEEELTFSGFGTVTIDEAASGLSALDALSLSIETLGALGPDETPVVFRFDYGLDDVVSVSGLDGGPVAPDLSGVVIDFASMASLGEEVQIGGFANSGALTLDFGAEVASGFCFGIAEDGLAQCIRGGGSSSGLEAGLSAAIIPLPATLPLLLAGLGALALRRRRAG